MTAPTAAPATNPASILPVPRATATPVKPPSSIAREQNTLHLPSGEVRELKVKGRHDPVIGPRAVPVVEAVARLVVADLGMIGGFLSGD
jgi:chorismate synthase